MTLDDVDAEAQAVGLCVVGAFHPDADDGAPKGCATLVLLGPDEPRFWPRFSTSPEYRDDKADPLDRWSQRVVGDLATRLEAIALFPFGGPPYAPFLAWAKRSGRAVSSPVGLLVHDKAGLFVSFRGALALNARLALPQSPKPQCPTCHRPCLSACPVGALNARQIYDVAACKAHVTSAAGVACRDGCLVRRVCPVSQSFGRLEAQSAFHMTAFL